MIAVGRSETLQELDALLVVLFAPLGDLASFMRARKDQRLAARLRQAAQQGGATTAIHAALAMAVANGGVGAVAAQPIFNDEEAMTLFWQILQALDHHCPDH